MAVNVGESLRQIVGDEAVLDRAEEMDGYLHDWFQRFTGKAHAVVLPNTTEQVAAIMKFAADHKIVVVPQGGNTGMMGAATPDDNGNTIMLSLRRMNKIREIDQTNMSMTVEAGCILQDLQNAAEAEPHRPTPMTQDELLGLFDGDEVGRDVVLQPATLADLCNVETLNKPSLEVVYDNV